MKKFVICSLIIALSGSASAQVSTDWGIGYDLSTNKPVATIAAGYETHNVVIEGEMTPSITRGAEVNNFFGIKAGYSIGEIITTSVGYYYNYKSADKTELNCSSIGYSLKIKMPLVENGSGLFLNGLYIKNQVQITAGIHAVL